MGWEYEKTCVTMFVCFRTVTTALRLPNEPAANLTTALDSESQALASQAVPPTLDAMQPSNLPKKSPIKVKEYEPEVARWEHSTTLKTGADAESKFPETAISKRDETINGWDTP